MQETKSYQANFSKGALMVQESRIVADLLLREVDSEQWRQTIGQGYGHDGLGHFREFNEFLEPTQN